MLPHENPKDFGSEDNVWRLLEPWGIRPDNADLERAAVTRFEAKYLENWRAGRPAAGTYRVFSKSVRGVSSTYGVTFRHMIRFAHGRSAAIGFHSIPRYRDGYLVHPASMLGLPIGWGGCPHLTEADARWLYSWAGVGTTVVVVR